MNAIYKHWVHSCFVDNIGAESELDLQVLQHLMNQSQSAPNKQVLSVDDILKIA